MRIFLLILIIVFCIGSLFGQEFHHTIQFSNGRFEEPNLDEFVLFSTDSLQFNENPNFSNFLETLHLEDKPEIFIESKNGDKRYFLFLNSTYYQEYPHTEGAYKLKIVLELKQIVTTQKSFYGVKKDEYKIFENVNYEVVNGYFEYFRFRTLVYALLEEGFIEKKAETSDAFWGNIYLKFRTVGIPENQDYASDLTVIVNDKFESKKNSNEYASALSDKFDMLLPPPPPRPSLDADTTQH